MNPPLTSPSSSVADQTPDNNERIACGSPVVAATQQATDAILQPAFTTELSLSGDRHRVSAIYPGRMEADFIRERLLAAGFATSAVEILQALPLEPAVAGSDEVLKDMVVVPSALRWALALASSAPPYCGRPA